MYVHKILKVSIALHLNTQVFPDPTFDAIRTHEILALNLMISAIFTFHIRKHFPVSFRMVFVLVAIENTF